MRAWILVVVVACGGSRATPPPPGPASPSDELRNVEPPVDAAIPIDAPCPRQCMDVCCQEDEICSHGRSPDDGTYAKCLRRH